jgi:hypothetical protein
VKTQLAPLFDGLQTSFNTNVLPANLPVVGNHLRDISATQIFTNLRDAAHDPINALPDMPTAVQVQQALQTAFGPQLMGSVAIGGDGTHEVTWDMNLHTNLTGGDPVSFDLGLSHIGFSLGSNLNVQIQAGYTFHFKFGVNDTFNSVFVDVSDPHDLTFTVNATATTTGVGGHLGFFTFSVNSNNSTFNPQFAVNFTGPNGDRVALADLPNLRAPSTLNGTAAIRLGLGVDFPSQAVDVRLRANLDVDWNFVNADPQATEQNLGNVPDVRLDNIQMNLSGFFTNYLQPIVHRIDHVVEPIAKVIAQLDRPIPGFEKVSQQPPTFLDLLSAITGTNRDYFDTIEKIVTVLRILDDTSIGAEVWIDLGQYRFTDNGADARRVSGPDQVPVRTVMPPPTPALTQARNQGGAMFFDAAQVNLAGGGMHFPVLEDPISSVKLFFSQPVDLVSFQTPTLHATFQHQTTYNFVVPPFFPFYITFGGSLNFDASLKFGFDTSGLATGNILDGFFIDLRGNPALFTVQATVGVAGGLGSDLGDGDFGVNLTLAGAGVSLTGTVNFVPRHMPADGKLRLTQIQQDWDNGIGSFFATTGSVAIHGEFFAEATISAFGHHKSIHHRMAGFDKTLFDFASIGVQNSEPQIPQTIHWLGVGTDWNSPQNWDTGMVPRPIDDVVIAKGYAVLNTNATVHSLTLSGGVVGGIGTLTISGPFTWTGGTMTGSGTTVANGGMEISGDERKTLDGRHLQDSGSAVWKDNGEIYTAHGALWENMAGATLDIQTSAGMFESYGFGADTFVNHGTVVRSTSTGSLDLQINVNNSDATSLFDIRTGTVNLERGVAGSGRFQVAAGATLDFEGPSFSLSASSGITGAGTVDFDVPATVTLPANYNVTGTTNVNLGMVVFAHNATAGGLVLQGGEIGVTDGLTVTDQLMWTDGGIVGNNNAVLTANGGAVLSSDNEKWLVNVTFVNNGSATWSGAGALLFIDGAGWNNAANSVLDAQGDSAMFYLSGRPASFQNAGTLKKSAGSGTTYVTVPITNTNTGTVQGLAGTLTFDGGGSSVGAITATAPGVVDFHAGTYTLASAGGTGTFTVSGATVTVSGALTAGTINVTDGALTASGAVTATALVVREEYAATAMVTFNGTVSTGTFTASTFAVGGQAVVVFQAATTISTSFQAGYNSSVTVNGALTGTVPVFGVGGFGVQNAVVSLTNAATTTTGQFAVASGGFVTISGPLTNQGSFTVTGGSVTLANTLTTQSLVANGGATTLNGASTSQSVSIGGGVISLDPVTHQIIFSSGGSVVIGGSLTTPSLDVLGATASGLLLTDPRITLDHLHAAAGVFTVNGAASAQTVNLVGVVAGTGTLTATGSLAWTRGWMEGTGTTSIDTQAALTLRDSVNSEPRDKYLVQRTLRNAGTVTWLAGNIVGSSGGVVQNLANATFQDNSTAGIRTATIATVNNAGLIQLSVTTFNSDTLTNTGTLGIGAGARVVIANLTNYASNTLTGGTYLVTGTLQVTGADIRTNAATILLDGTSSAIKSGPSTDALANFMTNAAAGQFTIQNGRTFNPATPFNNAGVFNVNTNDQFARANGVFTNTGTFNIAAGQTLTVNGSGQVFNQNGGTLNIMGNFSAYYATLGLNGGMLTGNAPVLSGNATLIIGAGYTVPMLVVIQPGHSTLRGDIAAGQTVLVQGGTGPNDVADLTAPSGFTNAGTLRLDSTGSGRSSLTVTSGTLTNTGTIVVNAGVGDWLYANLINGGTVNLNTNTRFGSYVYTNAGTFSIVANQTLNIIGQTPVFNQNAGTLNIAGSFEIGYGGTFGLNGGMLTGNPPVLQSEATLSIGTGSTALGTVLMQGRCTLQGDIAAGQTVWIQGVDNNATVVDSVNSFTNAGTILLDSTGNYITNIGVRNGTLTNTGTITFNVGGGGPRDVDASIVNNGTININADTTFANPLYTNAGTFTVAANRTLSVGGINSTFNQNGGTLNIVGSFTNAYNIAFGLNGGVLTGNAPVLTNATLSIGVGSTAVGTVATQGVSQLRGDIAAGQTVWVQNGSLTAANGFNNAGTLRFESINTTSGCSLTVSNGVLANTGTIAVNPGGGGSRTLDGQIDNQGTLTIATNTTFNARRASTNSGAIAVNGGDLVIMNAESSVSFTDATTGMITVADGHTLTLRGLTFTNLAAGTLSGGTYSVAGTFNVGAAISTNAATLALDGPDARIQGPNGTDALANFGNNTAAGSFTVQNGFNFTTPGAFNNDGTLTVGSGSTFTVTGTYTQNGTANVQAGGTLSLQGPFSNFDPSSGTLTGGIYVIAGLFQFSDAATTPVATNGANLTLDGPAAQVTDLAGNDALGGSLVANAAGASLTLLDGASLSLPADFSNAGTLMVGAGSMFGTSGAYTQTGGTTTLANGTLAAVTVTLNGGSLTGSGTIMGDLVNAAQVRPGDAVNAGILSVTGNYTQTSNGTLNLKVGGTDPTLFDQLQVGGAARLDGIVNLNFGYAAAVNDSFTPLTAGSVSGMFAAVNAMNLDPSLQVVPSYDPGDVAFTLVNAPGPNVTARSVAVAADEIGPAERLDAYFRSLGA